MLGAHNAVRDVMAKWIKQRTGRPVEKDIPVPHWDTPQQKAVLDGSWNGETGRVYLDVSLVEPNARVGAQNRRQLKTIGTELATRERAKHRRYPGAGLVAMVMNGCGRMGSELEGFIQKMLKDVPKEEKGQETAIIRQRLSVAVQRSKAEAMLAASRVARPWAQARRAN